MSERNWDPVQIDDIFLTHDGTETGVAAKVTITAAAELLDDDVAVSIVEGAGGVPSYQSTVADSFGTAFEVRVFGLAPAIYNDLRALLKATRDNDPTHVARLIATGVPGTIDRKVKGDVNVASFESFAAGLLYGVVFRLRTYGLGS